MPIRGSGLPSLKGCRAYRNAAYNVPNAAWTPIELDVENFDTDTMHSTVTNPSRVTCVTPGVYLLSAGMQHGVNATGVRGVRIFLNNTTSLCNMLVGAFAGAGAGLSASTIYELAAGDYVELSVYQDSGAVLALTTGPRTSLGAVWLGKT